MNIFPGRRLIFEMRQQEGQEVLAILEELDFRYNLRKAGNGLRSKYFSMYYIGFLKERSKVI